jgi:hypothetical protein
MESFIVAYAGGMFKVEKMKWRFVCVGVKDYSWEMGL